MVSSFLRLSLLLIVFTACNEKEITYKEYRVNGKAQGTTYSIIYYDTLDRNIQKAVDSVLNKIDLSMSTYQNNSIISAFNEADSCLEIDELFLDVFLKSEDIHTITNGAFDPTVKDIVNIWGFGWRDTLANLKLSDSLLLELRDSLAFKYLDYVGFNQISLGGDVLFDDFATIKDPFIYLCKKQPNVKLDFNGIAQGYSVDRICYLLDSFGIHSYLVELGGELRSKGKKPYGVFWKVGLENPLLDKEKPYVGIMPLENRAMATSGSYRKFYKKDGKRYSHTIDPRSGMPVEHSLLSVTVIANNCISADAFATAFMVMGLEKSIEFIETHYKSYGIEASFIYENEMGNLESFTSYGIKHQLEMDTTTVIRVE